VDDSNLHFGDPEYGVIVSFLRGQRPDWSGRWLSDVRGWDHEQLESDHHYIQWLFPLTTESEAVFAPILRQHEISDLQADPQLRCESEASLRQLLGFFGFELRCEGDRPSVVASRQHGERQAVWMTPGNHNYRRLSRILGSLTLQGMEAHAAALLLALERLYATPEGGAAIDAEAVGYWRCRAPAEQRHEPS